MDKRHLTAKTLIAIFCVLVLALSLSLTLYAYRTPKVYVAYVSKGVLNGELYDCVIPKEALHDGNTVYIAVIKNTVLGTRYRVYSENVIVQADDGIMAAVNLYADDGMMVVLAHDGRMKGNGDVLVYRS